MGHPRARRASPGDRAPDPGRHPTGADARVLELGAGTGLLGLALSHVGAVVLADASDGMLAVAEAKIATGAYPGPGPCATS